MLSPNALAFGAFLAYAFYHGYITWRSVLVTALAALVLFTYLLYVHQERLLYQPRMMPQFITPDQNPQGFRSPADRDLPFEDVYLNTPDNVRLHAWFIRPVPSTTTNDAEPGSDDSSATIATTTTTTPSRSRPTLLFFHANAGNMGFRMDNLESIYRQLGMNVFILSYRGYGHSTGQPSEEGLLIDAETAWQHLRQRPDVNPERLFVFGRSLGGNVAIALAEAHSDEIRGVIIENTFTSIAELVNSLFPLLVPLKPIVLRLRWPGIERVARVTCPLLFVSGDMDEIVPSSHMHRLYAASIRSSDKRLYTVANGKHNTTWMDGGTQYRLEWNAFVRKHDRDSSGGK